MISWKTVDLFDSDGGRPDDEQRETVMREFRSSGSMQEYWFVNLVQAEQETPDDPDSKVWDPFNNEYRNSWEAGPTVAEIDFTGLD